LPPADQPTPTSTDAHSPASFLAAAAALAAIDDALRDAQHETPDAVGPGPEQALASLMLLRQVRERLAGWETGLIETARDAGASWADLARPLGVASRQAAERRYLRSASAPTDQPGATRDDRVQAERDRRAGNRAVAQWANDNTADLRRLAGQITALTDLGEAATGDLAQLHQALGDTDATALPDLLAAAHQHLPDHPDLAAQIDTITTRTNQIRRQPPPHSEETT